MSRHRRGVGKRGEADAGCHINDTPASPCNHAGQYRPRAEKRASQVDFNRTPAVVGIGFSDRSNDPFTASIVDQEIDGSPLRFGLRNHISHRRSVGNIRTDRNDTLMDLAQFGDVRSSSSADRAANLPQPCRPIFWVRITGIRSCSSVIIVLAFVVTIVNVRSAMPTGHLNPSQPGEGHRNIPVTVA